jgi:hypothetical protein
MTIYRTYLQVPPIAGCVKFSFAFLVLLIVPADPQCGSRLKKIFL